jgi:hypothetical protein
MDYDVSHIFWGFVGVVVFRKLWNKLVAMEIETREVIGKPPEMREVDVTSMPGQPVYHPLGPFAVQ